MAARREPIGVALDRPSLSAARAGERCGGSLFWDGQSFTRYNLPTSEQDCAARLRLSAVVLAHRPAITGRGKIAVPPRDLPRIQGFQPRKTVSLASIEHLIDQPLADKVLEHQILEEKRSPEALARCHRAVVRCVRSE